MDIPAAPPAGLVPDRVSPPIASLQRLVVKDGVHLGGLPAAQLPWALGCAWAVLPAETLSEADVNRALKAALAGPACWLDTDHVELRRWLVDAGWLQRDGYGRAYDKRAPAQLAPPLQPVAAGLLGLGDLGAWVARMRQQDEQARAARRQAWQQQA